MRYLRGIRRGLPAGVCAGVGATLTMDASMVLASRLAPEVFATEKVDVNLIGRWVGGLGRGRRRGDDITTAPMLGSEVALGLATHYLTGIALTETYLIGLRRLGLRPGPVKATAFGVATSVLPLFVMYPSMGYGCCGRHSGDARRVRSIMLLGHTAFGVGIGLWTAYQTQGTKRQGTLSRYRA
jgi:hypothetical protein